MIKKLLSVLFVATCIFGATSCTSEDLTQTESGESVKVSFSLGLEGGIDTRAISDGSGTNRLVYAVFDQNGVRVDGIQAVDKSTTFPATEELTLVKNKTYKIAFWAQNSTCTAYTVNADAMTIGVNYAGLNNDETRDAFFKSVEVKVSGSTSIDVELKRALAQINVGVTAEDYQAAKNGGVEVNKSAAYIQNAATSLNALTGKVSGEAKVTYTENNLPNEDLVVDGKTYKWLSMSYILVSDESTTPNDDNMFGANQTTLSDLGFTFAGTNDKIDFKSGLTSVPVKRNCRTNIVGTLLTGKVDFNITIEEGYDKNYIYDGLYCVDGQNTYCIETPIALTYVADQINNGEWTDANFILGGDIDLSAITRAAVSNWTPMGTEANPFTGTFDGNGHTIKNLTIIEEEAKEGKAFIGFFGYAKNATIKNVTFENVELNIPCLDIDHSQGHIGAVAGSLEGKDTIENVTVKGDIKVEATVTANGASRVAVVAGGNSYGDVIMKNVHVKANAGSYLKANNNVGALAGQLQGKSVFENCTSNIDVTGTKFFAGGIIGLAAGDQTFTNCHTTGNVTITQGREGKAHDHFRVGGIAGGWADGANKVCTLTGCTYTGVVSGKSFEGVEADPLDYMGYVGRGYTLNGCQGSKVVIDGISFVQKYNTAAEAGIYDVTTAEGETINAFISSAADLAALSAKAFTGNNGKAEEYVIALTKDIDMNGAEFSAMIAQRGDKLTIRGNGHTISNVKVVSGANDNTTGQASMFYAFPNSTLTVSDLTIKNITVNADQDGTGYASALVGYCEGTAIFNNVDVVNATVTGVKSSGMLAGHLSGNLTATNCDLSGTITLADYSGEPDGHYAGKYFGTLAGPATINNCTVNVTVSGNLKNTNDGDIYGRKTAAGSLN